MLTDVVPITPEVVPGEVSPFTPLARDQKIKAFTSYPCVNTSHHLLYCVPGPTGAFKNAGTIN